MRGRFFLATEGTGVTGGIRLCLARYSELRLLKNRVFWRGSLLLEGTAFSLGRAERTASSTTSCAIRLRIGFWLREGSGRAPSLRADAGASGQLRAMLADRGIGLVLVFPFTSWSSFRSERIPKRWSSRSSTA